MNSSKVIIEKSISELKTQKISCEKEVISLDSAICTLENLISKNNIVENVKREIEKPRRKTRRNGHANRGKITEDSVRDAIIELVKNPPAELSGPNKLDKGFFTISQVAAVMGCTPQSKIKQYLVSFYTKGMLEKKKFLTGYQYRYITPVESIGKSINFKINPTIEQKIAQSVPIPGTGKNNIVIRNKDVEKMVAQAKAEGFNIERLGSDHLRISKNGIGKMATISATGRDKARYVENVKSDLRRIGVNV
jgi:hypothetical protein